MSACCGVHLWLVGSLYRAGPPTLVFPVTLLLSSGQTKPDKPHIKIVSSNLHSPTDWTIGRRRPPQILRERQLVILLPIWAEKARKKRRIKAQSLGEQRIAYRGNWRCVNFSLGSAVYLPVCWVKGLTIKQILDESRIINSRKENCLQNKRQ